MLNESAHIIAELIKRGIVPPQPTQEAPGPMSCGFKTYVDAQHKAGAGPMTPEEVGAALAFLIDHQQWEALVAATLQQMEMQSRIVRPFS